MVAEKIIFLRMRHTMGVQTILILLSTLGKLNQTNIKDQKAPAVTGLHF